MRQAGALPYRLAARGSDASVEILLITSRETRRWIIPKGNIDFNMAPHAAAAVEAEEEAGVRGKIGKTPIGRFCYRKGLASGISVGAKVVVYPLLVTIDLDDWKEKSWRERRWFPLTEAAEAVAEPDLRDLIRAFDVESLKMR